MCLEFFPFAKFSKSLKLPFAVSCNLQQKNENESCILTGEKLPKSNAVFDCLGNLDELAAIVQICLQERVPPKAGEILAQMLPVIHALSESIAGGKDLPETNLLQKVESWAGKLQSENVPCQGWQTFTGSAAVQINFARTVCRRAERSICKLGNESLKIVQVCNRLSTVLFHLAVQTEMEKCAT